jgi:hypothetical protein
MKPIGAIRFFCVVPLHSPLLLFALAAVGVVTAAAVVLDPAAGAKAAVPVMSAQLVAASTGFAARARRGHLDLLLTGGPSRLRVALGHLAMSTAPGLAVWAALGAVEIVASGGSSRATLSSGSATAIGVVSSLAWASTVPFPRLSGGIAWMLLMVTLLAISPHARHLASGATDASFVAGSLYLLCPFLLIGRTLAIEDLVAVAPALAASMVAVAGALTWIVLTDVPLEASQ